VTAERKYWVRTEHGRVWGPFTVTALERLRGQLTEKCEASIDGREWLPGLDFPELRELLAPARKIERGSAPPSQVAPRISKAMAEAFGLERTPVVAPQQEPAAPDPAPPPPAPAPRPAPVPEAPALELAESGDLESTSPVRLYGLAALTSANGVLQVEPEKGGALRIAFRRGTPEHLASDDPEQSLPRFLQGRGVLPAEKAAAAEEFARKSGQDVVAVLFQMQLLPPADAHRLLGEHALSLLDRALHALRGTFRFVKDVPPPPGSSPLGSRWSLLSEAVRKLDVPILKARLGKRLPMPVVRSGGLGVGKPEELALNAQEARLYAAVDGTHTGEELLKAHDPSMAIRVLYLLTELGHLAFSDLSQEQPEPARASALPPVPEPAGVAQEPPKAAARELPKTAREAGRPTSQQQRPAPARQAPPVMQASAPAAKPATPPPVTRPPPTFAQPLPDETPAAAVQRLRGLWDRLSNGDHYAALGMERKSASMAEAKRNFFVLARELHPDTVTDPAQTDLKEIKERLFARINEAAQVLSDDKRRKAYEAEVDGEANSVDVSRIFAAEENFQRAEILIKARKYQEGLQLLEDAIAMNADEAEFYAWRGYAKFLLATDRKGIFEQCASDCRKAIKMVERCLPAHLFLGQMNKALGDLKQAKKYFQRVLELDDKHVEAQRELRLMGQKA